VYSGYDRGMNSLDVVIWDWNGTLLDDRWLCIDVVNGMLRRRGLTPLTEERYLEIFRFPVVDYYELAGFDFKTEPFADLAVEYLAEYDARVGECSLHREAASIVERLAGRGVRQVILSASKQESLEDAVRNTGIDHHFSVLRGLADGHAVSKVDAGRQLIADLAASPDRTIMIGDTDHDVEVAEAIGIAIHLVSGGHQSRDRLAATARPVYKTLPEFADAIATRISWEGAKKAGRETRLDVRGETR